MVACNGTHGTVLENEKATLEGLAKLGAYLVPNFRSSDDYEDGVVEFASTKCASCSTRAAGYRARFAILGEESL